MARNLGFRGLLYLYGRIFSMTKGARLFLFLMLLNGACLDEPDCFGLNNNIVGFTFKNVADGSASTITFTGIRALGADSIFVASANKVFLPLNYFNDTTTFVFTQAERSDTIKMKYSSKAQFVSPDCGERYVLSGLDTVMVTFDSIRIITRTPVPALTVTNTIEIYN